jgi:cell division protease FtsH
VAADLRHATQKAVRMVREFGMDGEMGQVALHEVSGQRPDGGELAMVVARRAQAIVSAQLDRTLALLRADRARLDRLASELLTRNRLTRDELEVVLEGG